MSTALTGPAADLGQNMRAGVLAAFAEVNRKGGVRGRALELIVLDDGYEPARTEASMDALLGQKDLLGIIGNVGTPTAVVALPIVKEVDTLFFSAYSGAGVLRLDPPDHCVINYRASYAEETGAMVDALINEAGLRPEDIGFFTQRDSYGDAGFLGGAEALRRHGLLVKARIAHGRYRRNTEAIENGLADLLLHTPVPKAIIMVGSYAPCAKFILLSHEMGLRAKFLNVSFVGTQPLSEALGAEGNGVIITQVVPHFRSELTIASEYVAAMNAMVDNEQEREEWRSSFGSFEGYIAARILIVALQRWDGKIDRPGVISALEDLGDFDLGLGSKLRLAGDEHQASHKVWPTILEAGEARAFDWSELSID